MIEAGGAWGEPVADLEELAGRRLIDGSGDDVALAIVTADHPEDVLRFVPSRACDFARAIGLRGTPAGAAVLRCDAIQIRDGGAAVNAIVFGVAPDRARWWHRRHSVMVEVDGRRVGEARAFGVVVANGQYLRGADVVPRGHPGDGRIEVQVYALRPGERSRMRSRLARGTHVPHPRIAQRSGRRVTVRWTSGRGMRGRPWEVDGHAAGGASGADLEVAEGAMHILV
jgi:hypothetical protein